MNERINDNIIQANTKLVDENKLLKEDKQILQKRNDKAIEEIKYYDTLANHLDDSIYLDEKLANRLIEILKGEYIYEQ